MKLLSILCLCIALTLCLLALPGKAEAATSGTCGDNLTWNLDDQGILTISGTGAMWNWDVWENNSPWYNNTIKKVVIEDGVTTIGSYAFCSCVSMTEVIIGESVSYIGANAFENCNSLTSVDIPDNCTTVGVFAFSSCDSLTEVSIPDSVAVVGYSAFSGCDNLTYTVYDNAKYLGNKDNPYVLLLEGLSDTITSCDIHNNTKHIHSDAFSNCDTLAEVTIGKNVTIIDYFAFYDCASLTSVTIGKNVTTIREGAFSGCGVQAVYYAGTQTQWQAILLGDDNWPLANATIHYNHTHDYSLIPAVTVAATCTEEGYVEYTCTLGETYRTIIPATGHTTGSNAQVIAPNCTEEGYTISTCPDCGVTINTDFVAALGHDFTGEVKEVAPTCTEEGYYGNRCTRCEEIEKANILPALDHNMVLAPAVAPTCTKTGLTNGTKCDRCDFVGVAQQEVPMIPHSFEGGFCTGCGMPDRAPGDLDDIEGVDTNDVVALLLYLTMPDIFPMDANADFTGDGAVTTDDAVILLLHISMPDVFPLEVRKKD